MASSKHGCNILRPQQRSIWFVSRIGWMRRHMLKLDTQHLNGSIVRLRRPDGGKEFASGITFGDHCRESGQAFSAEGVLEP
jgi:hypothetical protein